MPSFQLSETEHELNVKGVGPWCDLLFVMTSLGRCINNVGAGKYARIYIYGKTQKNLLNAQAPKARRNIVRASIINHYILAASAVTETEAKMK